MTDNFFTYLSPIQTVKEPNYPSNNFIIFHCQGQCGLSDWMQTKEFHKCPMREL